MSKTLRKDIEDSPIPSTIDKFWESWYFLLMAADNYHDPWAFRYNLNAFIQALRNITFMLQGETPKPAGFEAWYAQKQDEMRDEPKLRRFVQARNLVVKKQMLVPRSTVTIGIYRGRRFKICMQGEHNPFQDSQVLLRRAVEFFVGYMLDKEHSAIGEQIGVGREWVVDEIGSGEVLQHCEQALRGFTNLIQEAHVLWGVELDASFDMPVAESYQVLLESDLNPDLPIQWGWM